jgi:hypothetical protein
MKNLKTKVELTKRQKVLKGYILREEKRITSFSKRKEPRTKKPTIEERMNKVLELLKELKNRRNK